MVVWYMLANDAIVELVGTLLVVGQTPEFKASTEEVQRGVLARAHSEFFAHPYRAHHQVITQRIYTDIELIFHAVGDPPVIADLPVPPVPRPPPAMS